MEDVQQLNLDLEEFQRMYNECARPNVKRTLSIEIHRVRSKISELNEKLKCAENGAAGDATSNRSASVTAEKVPCAGQNRYTKELTTYAWDQSEKFMKIYVTDPSLKGIHRVSAENITSEFGSRSFKVKINDLNGVNYLVQVGFLCDVIVPEDSYHKVKTDMLLIMLKKSSEKTWAGVTEIEKKMNEKKNEKKNEKFDEKADPNESLMNMLKKMYDEGDDDFKRTITKAWVEGNEKKKQKEPYDDL